MDVRVGDTVRSAIGGRHRQRGRPGAGPNGGAGECFSWNHRPCVHGGQRSSQRGAERRGRRDYSISRAQTLSSGRHTALGICNLKAPMETIPALNRLEGTPAASAGSAVIRVEAAHKYYELGETRVHALRGVSIEIHRGEFVAIMGASGSGKSTFMNILGCLDRLSLGRYLLEGIDVSKHDKKTLALIRNEKIGFVFQGFNLLARTTALENTELPTLYAKIDKTERRKRAADALKMVGLAERAQHFPSQMSGGQQQRVAIARALVNRPSILLADEPTGNLDSRTSVEIMEIFQNLNDKGLTIVLVTHELDIAQFARRVLVFRDGKIRKDDPVLSRPRASKLLKLLIVLDSQPKRSGVQIHPPQPNSPFGFNGLSQSHELAR